MILASLVSLIDIVFFLALRGCAQKTVPESFVSLIDIAQLRGCAQTTNLESLVSLIDIVFSCAQGMEKAGRQERVVWFLYIQPGFPAVLRRSWNHWKP